MYKPSLPFLIALKVLYCRHLRNVLPTIHETQTPCFGYFEDLPSSLSTPAGLLPAEMKL